MKKPLLITIGVLVLLLVLAVWGYLLFFGTPQNANEVFTDLGFGGESAPLEPLPDNSEPTATIEPTEINPDALRQLTLKPVAGFTFVGSSSSMVRYVEKGVGHVFELDLESGEEERVSGTTIPLVTEAIFSASGKSVALMAEVDYRRTIYVGFIKADSEETEFIELPAGAFDPHFVDDASLKLGITTANGTEGYEFDLTTEELTPLFTIPLRDVKIIWGDITNYVYPKASNRSQGALYEITNNTLSPLTEMTYGFRADIDGEAIVYTKIEDNEYLSLFTTPAAEDLSPLPVSFLPEKCSRLNSTTQIMWCGGGLSLAPQTIEDWYQGEVQFNDYIWRVSLSDQSATLFSNPEETGGRNIDIIDMSTDLFAEQLLFKNKIDNTLWLYDSTI